MGSSPPIAPTPVTTLIDALLLLVTELLEPIVASRLIPILDPCLTTFLGEKHGKLNDVIDMMRIDLVGLLHDPDSIRKILDLDEIKQILEYCIKNSPELNHSNHIEYIKSQIEKNLINLTLAIVKMLKHTLTKYVIAILKIYLTEIPDKESNNLNKLLLELLSDSDRIRKILERSEIKNILTYCIKNATDLNQDKHIKHIKSQVKENLTNLTLDILEILKPILTDDGIAILKPYLTKFLNEKFGFLRRVLPVDTTLNDLIKLLNDPVRIRKILEIVEIKNILECCINNSDESISSDYIKSQITRNLIEQVIDIIYPRLAKYMPNPMAASLKLCTDKIVCGIRGDTEDNSKNLSLDSIEVSKVADIGAAASASSENLSVSPTKISKVSADSPKPDISKAAPRHRFTPEEKEKMAAVLLKCVDQFPESQKKYKDAVQSVVEEMFSIKEVAVQEGEAEINRLSIENACIKLEDSIGNYLLGFMKPGVEYPLCEGDAVLIANFDQSMDEIFKQFQEPVVSSLSVPIPASTPIDVSPLSSPAGTTDDSSMSSNDSTLQDDLSFSEMLEPENSQQEEEVDIVENVVTELEPEPEPEPFTPPPVTTLPDVVSKTLDGYNYDSIVAFNMACRDFLKTAENILSSYAQGFTTEEKEQFQIKLDAIKSLCKNIDTFRSYIDAQFIEMHDKKVQLEEGREKTIVSTSLVPSSQTSQKGLSIPGKKSARKISAANIISALKSSHAPNMPRAFSGAVNIILKMPPLKQAATKTPMQCGASEQSINMDKQDEIKRQLQAEMVECENQLEVYKLALKNLAVLGAYQQAVNALCVVDDIHCDEQTETENEGLLNELRNLLKGCEVSTDAQVFSGVIDTVKEQALSLQKKKNEINKNSVSLLSQGIDNKKQQIIAQNKRLLSALINDNSINDKLVSECQKEIENLKHAIQTDQVAHQMVLREINFFDHVSPQLDLLVDKLNNRKEINCGFSMNVKNNLDNFNDNITRMNELLGGAINQLPESIDRMQECLDTLQSHAQVLRACKSAADVVLGGQSVGNEDNDAELVKLFDSISARRLDYLERQNAEEVNRILGEDIMAIADDIVRNYDAYNAAIQANHIGKYKILHETFEKYEKAINKYTAKRQKYLDNLKGNNEENGCFARVWYCLLSLWVNVEKIENKIIMANNVVELIKEKDAKIKPLIDDTAENGKKWMALKEAVIVVGEISTLAYHADLCLNTYQQSFFRPRSEYRAVLEGFKTDLQKAAAPAA